jgi:DedD protein
MFKLRPGGQGPSGPAQPPSIDVVRRRARHRLIGASVLVLAGVIGFPLLFDTQPRPIPVDIPIDIPARQSVQPLVAAEPVAAAPQAVAPVTPAPAVTTAPDPVPAAAEPAPAAPAPAVAAKVPAATEAARAQALLEGKSSAAEAVRVVVQVGAYADATRAQEVRQRLERAGLKTYTHVANTPQGPRTRVRLGPFDTRAEAEKAADKVKALGLPAVILTL